MEIKLINVRFLLRKRMLLLIMRTYIFLLCTTVFSFTTANSFSQEKVKIDTDLKVSIDEVFEIIRKQTKYRFLYPQDLFANSEKIQLKKGTIRVSKLLKESLSSGDFKVILTANDKIIIKKKSLKDKLQQKQVIGKVTDEAGLPVPGASIFIKGTTKGTATDFDGNYSITVPLPENVLVFSFLGFISQEITVNNQTELNVVLLEDDTELDEVVLIGYGSVKKRDVTGAIGTVKMKNITNQAPTVNLDHALQGQVAGVSVSNANGQPGAAAKIRIRGTTSLFGDNQPLFVIDGIPVAANSNIPSGGGGGNDLNAQLAQEGLSTPIGNINSADIESITILKDASAAAIYGSRAANGVIIIKTKRGAYNNKPKINVRHSLSTQTPITLDVLNAAEFRQVWTTAVENGSSDDAFAQSVLDGSYFGTADTNWEDEISPGSPITTTLDFNISGGSEKTRYFTSLGVNTQDGVYEGSAFDRYSYSLNLETNLNDYLTFGTTVNISLTDQQSVDSGITRSTYSFRPDLPVYDENGDFSTSDVSSTSNPVALSQARNSNKTLLILGSIFAELKLLEGLHFKTFLSLNHNSGNQKSFYPKFLGRGGRSIFTGADGDGYAQESRSGFVNTVFTNTLSYNTLINDKHKIDAVVGASFEKNTNSSVQAWGTGFSNEVLSNISSASVQTQGASFESDSGLESYFARVNYGYNDKYLLSPSVRIDGSSIFAENNTHAFFPALGAAWRISEESFLENADFIDDLKLRVSLGVTGQQGFGDYAWRTLFEASDYAGNPATFISQLGNDELKWETTNQFDLGLDFSFFQGRLSGTAGYYTKDTKDALFSGITPGSTGFTSIVANFGDTQNKGYELELYGDIIRKDDFSWSMSFNITQNKNKLTRISDDFLDEDGFITGFGGGGRLREGSPIGLIFGYVSEGIFQNQEDIDALNAAAPTGTYQDSETALGDLHFRDITGPDGVPDGEITNLDQQVIGNAQADFFGGLNSTFTYKGFSMNMGFTYSVGNDLEAFSLRSDVNFLTPNRGENKVVSVLNAWTPENTDTNIPRVVYRDPNQNRNLSSQFVYDASYIRLRTLGLNYSFSNKVMEKIKFIDNISINMTAQNLFTFTKYPGANPEASNLANNDISAGRDSSRFPIAKVFTSGIRISF